MDKIEQLLEVAKRAHDDLVASEAALAELQFSTAPTTDLAVETRRVAELTVKTTALQRVIVAQRQALADAEQAVADARLPIARAEYAELRKEIEARWQRVVDLQWQVYEATADAYPLHLRESALRTQCGDKGAAFATKPIADLQAARDACMGVLTQMGVANIVGGFETATLVKAPTPAEREAKQAAKQREQRMKRVFSR